MPVVMRVPAVVVGQVVIPSPSAVASSSVRTFAVGAAGVQFLFAAQFFFQTNILVKGISCYKFK